MERLEGAFTSASGLAERRSSSGHCTSLTTFSAIEPKTRDASRNTVGRDYDQVDMLSLHYLNNVPRNIISTFDDRS